MRFLLSLLLALARTLTPGGNVLAEAQRCHVSLTANSPTSLAPGIINPRFFSVGLISVSNHSNNLLTFLQMT
jgi:hypothetical protein